MRGFQKYERNWILTMAFWATCKIAQPIQPIWQHIFALPWSALKKPPWEFNSFHIFRIPSSSRHEKCCQILQTLFLYFNTLKTHCGYYYGRFSFFSDFLAKIQTMDVSMLVVIMVLNIMKLVESSPADFQITVKLSYIYIN